ncbi:MAG TPA: hypothetical protein VK364_02215, partial [Hymenobacter sp.]|nr:hypothetical protein [Hymenobacter sp.]
MKKITLWAGLWALSLTSFAQTSGSLSTTSAGSKYDPLALFHPLFNMQPGNDYRSGSGAPGPRYWQNRADYQINVSLDDQKNSIAGEVTITYRNNSPESLPFLWLQLDQNAFSDTSRASRTTPVAGGRFGNLGFAGGLNITSVTTEQDKAKFAPTPYAITDTRMQVRLAEPVKPGGEVKVKVAYSFKIPEYGSDRMGQLKRKDGVIYEIAQWYPRMCVYDDIEGWNV